MYIKISKNENSLLFDGENKVTYAELLHKIEKNGDILKRWLPPKSKCAILCDKGLNFAIAILSCWYADLVAIPMSKNYGEKYCKNIIDLTKPDVVICDTDISFGGMRFDIAANEITNGKTVSKTEEILCDVAAIMCTSGTTGRPKGAMITERGLIKNVENIAAYFGVKKDDAIMIARPLYHCAALTGEFLVSLYKGLNIGFFDESYDPISAVNFINENEITVFCGTPTMLKQMAMCLRRTKYCGGVKTIAVSGECLTKKAAEHIRSAFRETSIYNVYGLTEAAPRVSYLPPEYFDEYPESVGIPLNDTFVKIVDGKTGADLPGGANGRILVKSPSVMKGYYENEVLTQSALIDGWLDTGDIGYKNDNGFLYVVSRADDMIIKAGMNIYPKEIENAIDTLDIVESNIAYGVRGADGENIAIDVVLSENAYNTDKKELMKMFSSVLAPYQMPTIVNIVSEHKKNASGKTVRRRVGN